LTEHLEGCEGCRRDAFYYSEITASATRLEQVSVRPDFDMRLRAAIRRADAELPARSRWFGWLTALGARPVWLTVSATMILLASLGAYQFSDFNTTRSVAAEHAAQGEQGRLERAAAMGLPAAEPILPAGWTPIDGISPEMQRLQNQYLANDQLRRDYIMVSEGLHDPLSKKPRQLYVMPTVPSEQVVKKVSY
jgi:hypothetical protein